VNESLYHEKAIDRFQLGFADQTLGLRLPIKVGLDLLTILVEFASW